MPAAPQDPDRDLAAELTTELAWVRRLARRLVGEAGDDVAQDVAVAALRAAPPASRLRAWLGGAVRKRAAFWHRDAHRRAAVEAEHPPAPPAEDPQDVLARLQWQRELVDAVTTLPEPYRSVVVARFFDDLPPKAIAQRRGVPDATVRKQLERGLAMLRARLEARHGRDWGAGLGALVTVEGVRAGTTLGIVTMGKKLLGAAVAVAILSLAVGVVRSRGGPPEAAPAGESAVRTAAVDAGRREAREVAREPVATDSVPTAAALELRVVTDSDRVLADAELVVGGEYGVTRERTDADGEASLAGTNGSGHVLVLAPARPPRLFELPELRGQHTLILPDGARVAGRVELLGDPAQVPFLPELELTPSGFEIARLPQLLAKAIDVTELRSLRSLRVRIGNDRTFVFEGLSPDWSGTLGTGQLTPFWTNTEPIDEPRDKIALSGPRENLQLFLTPLPGVFGRVVWEDGSPVPTPDVLVTLSQRNGDRSISGWGDGAGRFMFPIHYDRLAGEAARRMSELRSVRIGAKHADATGYRRRTVLAAELGPGNDTGVLVLERAVPTHVLVVDHAGSPIEGALVESAAAQRTNAAGRAIVRGEPSAIGTRRIGAPGARVDDYQAVTGTGDEQDPLRFLVEPSNGLTILVASTRLPLGTLKLELQSHTPVFTATDEDRWMPTGFHRAAGGATCRSGGHGPGPPPTWTYDIELDGSGRARLVSMRPGIPIRVRVLDELKAVAAEARLRTPPAETSSTLELTVPDAVTRLHGIVRLHGRAIAGAGVVLEGDGTSLHARSEADGSYEVLTLPTRRPTAIRVSHPAAAAGTRRDVVLTAGEQELDFDLVPGHALTILVRAPDDTPIDAAIELHEPATGERVDAFDGVDRERVTVGHVHLDHLRAGTFRLRGTIAGRIVERDVRVPSDEPVVLRIPELPHCTVLEGPATGLDHIALRITDAKGHGFEETMLRRGRGPDRTWWHRELWLFPGTYEVVATSDGMAPATARWTIPAPDGRVQVPAPIRR